MTGCPYITRPAKVFAKQTRSAYQGLTPNKSPITTPIAGYQATSPMREKKITSGRFNRTYTNTNEKDTTACRKIVRREYMNTISIPESSFIVMRGNDQGRNL
jgi:hypothetical protein